MMSYEEAMDHQQIEIHRLTSNIAAIQSLFPDSWNPTENVPHATWADRMGLVHELDDQWNYIQQPDIQFLQRRDGPFAWLPSPPRDISAATIQALFPNLWAHVYQVPADPALNNGLQDFRIRHWPIANERPQEFENDNEDYTDTESDWDSELEDDWESDSGIETQSEASDDSWSDDSRSDASSTSSMRQPSPNEYIRRLEEFDDLQRNVYRDCPYCEWQRQYMHEAYGMNERPRHPENNHRRPW